MTFEEIRLRLVRLDTACLCDANKAIRVLDPEIRAVRLDMKLIGRAHTVSCRDDFLAVLRALKEAGPGEVLVVDGQQGHRALAGELFATEAARRGLAGLVVDGAVRDVQTLRSVPIPVYSRFVFPNAGTARTLCQTQIPVKCGGVTVHPGDIVFGDQDGVIVASEEELRELLPNAEEIQGKEERVLTKMAQGVSLLDMVNLDEHLEAIEKKHPSQLRFVV